MRSSHWDLMFQHGDVLRTWAVESVPNSDAPLDAMRLADHRLDYLEYEGPVSGDRGVVTRWDGGEYTLERETADEWVVTLAGARLIGRMTLERVDSGHCWRVSFVAAPING